MAPEQLAIQATGQHQVRVCGVGRETTDVAVGLGRQEQGFPSCAAVRRALDRPYSRRGSLAVAHKDDVRVIGLDRNGTSTGIGELLAHLQALPGLYRVGAGYELD